MTVEIKELVIKATVSSGGTKDIPSQSNLNTQEIVNACVEEVLKILKKEKER